MADPFGRGAGDGGPRREPVLGRRAALVALLAAGAAAAGCARIPTSGPVVARQDPGNPGPPRVNAPPPREGSTPEEIVDGFLRGAAIGDFDTAGAYLADRGVVWDPDTEVVLHTSQQLTVVGGDTRSDTPPRPPAGGGAATRTPSSRPPREGERADVLLEATGVLATIDGVGRMSVLDAAQTRRRRFGLVVRRGQWRIDALENGLTITLSRFVNSSGFAATPVYFPDATGRWLVPDVRYVRRGRDYTQTQVVDALLDGPSPWLLPGVRGWARHLELKVSSVPVEGGLATVDLKEGVLGLDERSQQVLQSQLDTSLSGVQGQSVVTGVEVTVDGQPLRAVARGATGSSGAGQLPSPASRSRAGDLYVAVDDRARVVTGSGTQVRPVDRLALSGGARPAMSFPTDARTYALLVTGRQPGRQTLKVAELGTPALDVVSADVLTSPSFDVDGWVWTSPRRSGGVVTAGLLTGGQVRRADVRAPWLEGRDVVSLRISREGARALLLVDEVAGDGRRTTSVLLCSVQREPDGRPLSLGGPVRLVPDVVRATDAGWLDDVRVVVLGSRSTAPDLVQPCVVDVGGDPSTNGVTATAALGSAVVDAAGKPVTTAARWERLPPDVAPSLAVGDSLDALYVSTGRAGLWRYRETGSWERLKVNAVRPAFPG